MPDKPKIGFYWCASCGGCEEAVVDLAEDILGVVEAVDIVFWPVAMDFKKKHVEAMPDKSIVATLLNGAIRTSEQEEMARLLRRKSQYLIAYGACAQLGGIPSLANQFPREQLLRYVYEEAPTVVNEAKTRPQTSSQNNGHTVTLPEFHNVVRALDQVVEVDFYIPGCPPTPKITKAAIGALLAGKLPPKGSVLAPDVALCDQCPRKASKPADLSFTEFKRPHQVLLDPNLCLLAQGVVCMGPATRGGCEAALSRRQHALHRLFRANLARARPGRKNPLLLVRQRCLQRTKRKSAASWPASPTPWARSTATGWARVCCGAR